MPEKKSAVYASRLCLAWSVGMLIASALGSIVAVVLSNLSVATTTSPTITNTIPTTGNLINQSEMAGDSHTTPPLNATLETAGSTVIFLYTRVEEDNGSTTGFDYTASGLTTMDSFMSITENRTTGYYNNSVANFTDKFDMKLTQAEIAENIVYLVVLLPIAIFGNILTIAVTTRLIKQRKSPADFLIGSLAASDLLVTIVVHSQTIASMAAGQWLGGQTTCSFQSFFCWSFWKTSFFCIQFLTIERYLAFSKPFFYRVHITMTKVKILVVLIFIVSFGSSLGTVTSHTDALQLRPGWYLCINDWTLRNSYFFSLILVNGVIFVIGITVFSFCNGKVVAIMLKAKKITRNKSASQGVSSRTKQERRFAWLIIAISIIFLIFWVPYWLFIVLHQIDAYHNLSAENIAIRILFFNSLINPLLYAAFRQIYRQGFCYYTKLMLYYLTCTLIKKPKDVFKKNLNRATTITNGNSNGNKTFSQVVKRVQISQKVVSTLNQSEVTKETDLDLGSIALRISEENLTDTKSNDGTQSNGNVDGHHHQQGQGSVEEGVVVRDDSGVETGEDCSPNMPDKNTFSILVEDNLPINEREHMTQL